MPPPTSQPRKPDPTAKNNERNQYIPSFISTKPFYVPDSESTDDYLEHQRLQAEKQKDSQWYDRSQKIRGPVATKFRKGACENCGSMTHKVKDCLSRKRKAGARYTGKDIQADEVLSDVNMGWDAKRDRWNGYDATQYDAVVQEYNELEALKKTNGDGGEEGDRYEEETDMGRQQSTSTRQLRLREDTAKYLLNLDLDSAKYDPKTRSMLDPGAMDDQAAALVAEEGFVRKGGDAAEFEKAQKYAWERQEYGEKLHLQANPTAGALAIKHKENEERDRKEAQRKALLEKYGSQVDVQKAPLVDAITASETFVEYDESGGIKGAPKIKPKSRYAEDVFIQNHTSVWGSWWSNFQWGYSCCHSVVKNSYCTGDAGIEAFEDERRRKAGIEDDEEEEVEARKAIEAPPEVADLSIKNTEKADTSKRKRTVAEMTDGITEEEMDAYRRKRTNAQDPMAKLMGKDELL
jgi:pre-mRNA-processing factor SLU7